MSARGEQLTEFERQSRLVLEESVHRIDSRIRSRLNQARQAAVEAASARRRPVLGRFFIRVPTAGAVAAALLMTMILWHHDGQMESSSLPLIENAHPGEDLELLADGEALDLVQDGDGSGSFYEWAADQSEPNGGGETDT
jgi:hypothetical protein